MPDRTGKCTNYTKCTLAYRNEPVAVSGDFVCPECGQPLTEASAGGAGKKPNLLIIGAVVGVIVLGLGIFVLSKGSRGKKTEQNVTQTEPATTPAPATPEPATPIPATPEPIAQNPIATPVPELPPVATPIPATPPPVETPTTEVSDNNAPVQVEANINSDLQSNENKRIKQEVLNRIDVMPDLTQAERNKLYTHVDRARGMGKVITIPFGTAQSTISGKDIDQLRQATQSPQVVSLLKDPTVVFVVLGFADRKGDPRVNLKISKGRADSVVSALKEKCGFKGIMHAVGMGGSELFDSGDFAKNRVVEVWAVLP